MGVGNSNKNVFQIFGIDILVDKKGNPWLLEINNSPSLCMYNYKYDEEKRENKKIVCPVDKEIKTWALADAIKILRDDFDPLSNSYHKIYQSNDDPTKLLSLPHDNYSEFWVLNDARVLFELMAGYKRPEYLNIHQF